MTSEDPVLEELTQRGLPLTAEAYKAAHPMSKHWHKDPEMVPPAYITLSAMETHLKAIEELKAKG